MKDRVAALLGRPVPDASSLRWKAAWYVYWLALAVLSSLVVYKLNWVPHKTGTIYDISSGFAPYVRSLIETHRFAEVSLWGARRTTMRLPAIPLFHWALSLFVGKNVVFHLLAKNVLVVGLCADAVRRFAIERRLGPLAPFVILGSIYLNPVGFRILPTMGAEEAYYAPVLVVLFVTLSMPTWTPARMNGVGAILSVFCLTKSTLTIVAVAVLVYVILRAPRRSWVVVPVAYVAVALGGWSAWSHYTAHRWTHVVNISAYDGINFFKGNNEYVEELYPDVHLDVLDAAGLTRPPDEIRDDEWAVSDYFRHRGAAYLLADGRRTLHFLAFKAGAPFVLPNSPARIYVGDPIPLAELSRIAARAHVHPFKARFVAASLWMYKMLWLATIAWAARSLWLRRDTSAGLLYLLLSGAIAAPFVVGFAYINHLCVLYTLMLAYAWNTFFVGAGASVRLPSGWHAELRSEAE